MGSSDWHDLLKYSYASNIALTLLEIHKTWKETDTVKALCMSVHWKRVLNNENFKII